MSKPYLQTLKEKAKYEPSDAVEKAFELGRYIEKTEQEEAAMRSREEKEKKPLVMLVDCLLLSLIFSFVALLTFQSLLRVAIAGAMGFSLRVIIYLGDRVK